MNLFSKNFPIFFKKLFRKKFFVSLKVILQVVMLLMILCFISFAHADGVDCTVVNSSEPSCSTGECQYRIYGSFDYSKIPLNSNGQKNEYNENVACQLIIESDSSLTGGAYWIWFDKIEITSNHVATFVGGGYLVHNALIFDTNSYIMLKHQ